MSFAPSIETVPSVKFMEKKLKRGKKNLRKEMIKKIKLGPEDIRTAAPDFPFGTATAVGLVRVIDKINELIDELRPEEKWPMKEGQREMWAVLGSAGGIYGFASSADKAKQMQRDYWNIGNRKPERYLVTFKKWG